MLKLLVILLVYTAGALAGCEESDQIECGTSTRCTRMQYICDGDNDCGDYSDENSDLCEAWRNDDCSRGEALCRKDGSSSCTSLKAYCRSDPPCEGTLDRRLCQMINNEKLQELDEIVLPSTRLEEQDGGVEITANLNETLLKGEDFMHLIPHAIKHEKCPQLYTQVGEHCISLFFFGNMTWGEARKFCQVIGGDLYQPSSDEEFDTLTHHMRDHAFESDFWIGGNFYNNTVGWRWVDEKPMDLKTNHWAVVHDTECIPRDLHIKYRDEYVPANDGICYNYYQAPYVSDPFGSCVAMTYKRFYFLSDESCSLMKSPLCKLAAA